MSKIIVQWEYHERPEGLTAEQEDWLPWLASIPDMPGMIECGYTKESAFNELMKSLIVKIRFDNDMDMPKSKTWHWNDWTARDMDEYHS